jgi:hypothetical protein
MTSLVALCISFLTLFDIFWGHGGPGYQNFPFSMPHTNSGGQRMRQIC